jgi:polysaccharide export outer membrane protein
MQEAISTKERVRSDGKVSIPFVGDVVARGKTPAVVAKEVEMALRSFINAPSVTVTVEEFQPITVSVVGEVTKAATVPLDRDAGVLQAIANAGGLTENANRDAIFVLRELPTPQRIRFTYDLLTQNPGLRFRLRTGDVVVVE